MRQAMGLGDAIWFALANHRQFISVLGAGFWD